MSPAPLSKGGHSKCRITARDAFHVVAVKNRRKVCDGALNVTCMHLSPNRYSEALNAIRPAVRTATSMEEPHGRSVIKDDGGFPQTFVLGLTGSIGACEFAVPYIGYGYRLSPPDGTCSLCTVVPTSQCS